MYAVCLPKFLGQAVHAILLQLVDVLEKAAIHTHLHDQKHTEDYDCIGCENRQKNSMSYIQFHGSKLVRSS